MERLRFFQRHCDIQDQIREENQFQSMHWLTDKCGHKNNQHLFPQRKITDCDKLIQRNVLDNDLNHLLSHYWDTEINITSETTLCDIQSSPRDLNAIGNSNF
jgi:hypothetical protein